VGEIPSGTLQAGGIPEEPPRDLCSMCSLATSLLGHRTGWTLVEDRVIAMDKRTSYEAHLSKVETAALTEQAKAEKDLGECRQGKADACRPYLVIWLQGPARGMTSLQLDLCQRMTETQPGRQTRGPDIGESCVTGTARRYWQICRALLLEMLPTDLLHLCQSQPPDQGEMRMTGKRMPCSCQQTTSERPTLLPPLAVQCVMISEKIS
jgi:hypothetical protein